MKQTVDKTKFTAAIFRRGQKKELFEDGDGDESEQVELDHKLRELYEMWKVPRGAYVVLQNTLNIVTTRSSPWLAPIFSCSKDLSAAIWRPQYKAAEVVIQKGKLFSHMGFMWGKKLFLHIEEAMYVADVPIKNNEQQRVTS